VQYKLYLHFIFLHNKKIWFFMNEKILDSLLVLVIKSDTVRQYEIV
jgi:hypothetical protein